MSERSLRVMFQIINRLSMNIREKIVKSAVGLFIQQGVDKTTTKQIATQASVAEGSIYRYFRSKDELAWQVFKHYHQYLAYQLQASAEQELNLKQKINSLVGCFLKMADEDWLMFRYYLTSQHTYIERVSKDMLTPFQVLTSVVEHGIEAGDIKVADKNVLTAMLMGAVHQIAINKIYSRISGELYVHCEQVTNTLINMLEGGCDE